MQEWGDIYRPLNETIEQRENAALLELYVAEYKKRYSTEPVFDLNNSHLTTIKDIRRICKGKAHDIVRHFFKMNDDWFVRMGHSLETLKKSISSVNADMGKKKAVLGATQPGGLRLAHAEICDKCKIGFLKEYVGEYPPPPYFCMKCLTSKS